VLLRCSGIDQICPPLANPRCGDLTDGQRAESRGDVVAEDPLVVVARAGLERALPNPSAAEVVELDLREPRVDPVAASSSDSTTVNH
jgi:hypothetical protein